MHEHLSKHTTLQDMLHFKIFLPNSPQSVGRRTDEVATYTDNNKQ